MLIRGKWFKFDHERQKVFPLMEAYGEWEKLLRVTAMVFRAVHNFQKSNDKREGILTNEELDVAHRYLVQRDQEKMFPKELEIVENNIRGVLSNLVILHDKEYKFIRIDRRVRSSNLTRDEQFPIVLSKNRTLAPLLVQYAHCQTKHGGNQLTLHYLRKRYWMIGAKRLIKNIIRKCPICFRLRMQTSEQLMASLPNFRTTPQRAFRSVGIDYAGPMGNLYIN